MDHIASLTDEQAEQAVLLLFDLLPVELWKGRKPKLGGVEGLAEKIFDSIPALRLLLESPGPQRGVAARTVLEELSAEQVLQPYVETALAQSTKPLMLTGLEIAGIVALVLFVAKVRRVRVGPVEAEFDSAKDAAELVQRATEFVDKIQSG